MRKAVAAAKQKNKIQSNLKAAFKELAAIRKSGKKKDTLEMFLSKL